VVGDFAKTKKGMDMRKFNITIILLFLLLILGFFADSFILNFLVKNRIDLLNVFFIFVDKYLNYYFLALLITLLSLLNKNKIFNNFLKLWVGFILSSFIAYMLKIIIIRPRPIFNLIELTSYSFPSGHTTIMFTLFILIFYNFPKYKYIWLVISLIIAFSRLYLGVHYFTDVIAGVIIGLYLGKNINDILNKY